MKTIEEKLKGMREDGQVKEYDGFTLAEYEPRGLRLIDTATFLHRAGHRDFLLYDYKGTVISDSIEVYRQLKEWYKDDTIYVKNDAITVWDCVLVDEGDQYKEVWLTKQERYVLSDRE